ncbi:MAG TPA: 1-acyl-sn-glycerol-3-phosphate acyltransferase [Gemmatimonadota bacterium]|nr:1-acyl-sn-glycerol-3-phosphate acyltransferase [Gemmatimonadota bacterium]
MGPAVPEGPVLIVANHPNVFLDAFVVFRTAGRPARPLAKASHFENPVYGLFLRALGGLPVHRPQDDPARMPDNEETFRAAVAALRGGDVVQIYPEGRSHSEPALAPLRTGAARIALRAEAEAGWNLRLAIVPIGLTYERKTLFRGRAAAFIGEPFGAGGYRQAWEREPVAAIRGLTQEIADRLEAVTLNLTEAEDFDLIEIAERLYAREKGWAGWREREGLGGRLPRLQAFARGLAWLRAHDPGRYRRLALRVRRYGRLLERVGAGEADVPPEYRRGVVIGYALREALALGIGFPPAAAGLLAWYVPYLVPRVVARLARPESQAIATWKLAAAMVAFPAAWVGWILVIGWAAGGKAALIAALLLPPLGLFTLWWTKRWERVREDTVLFFRLLFRPGRRDRLAAYRTVLAVEFDALQREITG